MPTARTALLAFGSLLLVTACSVDARLDRSFPSLTAKVVSPEAPKVRRERKLLLPRLVVRPPEDLEVSGKGLDRQLRFAMAVENRGEGALDVEGRDGEGGRTLAVQRVFAREGDEAVLDHEHVAGEIHWHAAHGHYHFLGFARFELLDDSFRPAPNARAEKSSSCLRDSERFDVRLSTLFPHHFICSRTRQGISPGWADVYGRDLPGQEVGVGATPDGIYWLSITLTDAFETASSPGDHTGAIRIRLSEKKVEVLETLDGKTFLERRAAASATSRERARSSRTAPAAPYDRAPRGRGRAATPRRRPA